MVKASSTSWRDELDAAPPAAFVETRNAIAARLRQAGRTSEAAEIARRRRPNAVLWLVNRLAKTDPADVRELLESTDCLRRSQLRDPRALPEATARHREALQQLVQRAERILASAGMRSSSDIARRVRTTLSAAAADRRMHPLLRQGRLSEEMAPSGFEALDAAPVRHLTLVRSPKGRDGAATSELRRGNAADREQLQATQREAKAQRRQAMKQKAEMARRQRRIDQASRQAARLREQLRKVEERIERERRPGDQ